MQARRRASSRKDGIAPQRGLTAAEVLVQAVFLGVFSGFVEAAGTIIVVVWGLEAADGVVAPEILWAAPLVASLFFIMLGLTALAVVRLIGRPSLSAWIPSIFVALAVFGFGRSLSAGIHPIALAILAIGAGVLATRALSLRPEASQRWMSRFAAGGAIAVLVWMVWMPQTRRIEEARVLDALPDAAEGAPNVLLVVWDTVRALSLSVYGYERETTPTLDGLASSSVLFERAISTAPWTVPSHASLFTGLYAHEHGARRYAPLAEDFPTLAEALSARGYRTGGFVSNTFWLGRSYGFQRGFQRYVDGWFERVQGDEGLLIEGIIGSWWISTQLYLRVRGEPPGGTWIRNVPAARVTGAFESWLDSGDSDRPFFAFLNLFDAHEPYRAAAPTGWRFSDGEPLREWDNTQVEHYTPAQYAEFREAYDAAIYHLDYQLGKMLEGLAARGELDNTLVIVTADHGETLGEHGSDQIGHGQYIYFDILNVPLVFHFPSRFPEGVRRGDVVSLVDVPATVLEIVDGDRATGKLPGRSLVPMFTAMAERGTDTSPGQPESGVERSPALAELYPADWMLGVPEWPVSRGPLYSLVNDRWHYIVNTDEHGQLFDHRSDVWSTSNRVADPGPSSVAAAMRQRVGQLLEGSDAPGRRTP